MSARAFISCGQREPEREAASAVATVLRDCGIEPYVAVAAQSIQDINAGVIAQLRRSDYYTFIDFRREALPQPGPDGNPRYRGSLFTHQELAIAYELGFEHVLLFQQRGTALEGMSAYIASNAALFDEPSELPNLVANAVSSRGWSGLYSRNIIVANLAWSPENVVLKYEDLEGRFLYIDIRNRRPDKGAVGTVARLSTITDSSGLRPSPIRSHLKVTGHVGAYEQTIWPLSHGSVDLLCLGLQKPASVYLNTALDLHPRSPVLSMTGSYILEYEVFAESFPVTQFAIKLELTDFAFSSTAELL
jgi:hypothetical protein